jgi:hypothetical protein
MGPGPSPKTRANKVICAHPELSGATKSIACLIIDHCNPTTGRCDPGLDRLSRLAACQERTVRRAVKHLDELGLIRYQSHRGTHGTNAYSPNWEHFRSLCEALEAREPNWWERQPDISVTEYRTFLSKTPDKSVPLNLEGNLEDKTLEGGCPVKRGENGANVADLIRRQILDHAHARFGDDPGYLRRLLSEPPGVWREAVTAELKCAGDGLRILQERQACR